MSGASEDAVAIVPRVLVFFDYACPFCYLDWPRLKLLRAEHGAELFLVPFELRPQLAPEGVRMADLGEGHSERVEEHMRMMAREAGLELAFPDFLPNTHLALAAGELARDAGSVVHEAVHEALFTAYNGRAEDIGRIEVIVRTAAEAGLDADDVAEALADGRFDERLNQFRHLALHFGITATPAALICNELFIGARPYRVLEEALQRCLVSRGDMGVPAGGDRVTD